MTTTVPLGPSQLIWKADTTEPVVSLTFDAGSDRGFGEEILDFLAGQGISASFGMTGTWAESNPDLVQRMVAEGHTLMNHTYNHPHMETLTTAERLDQLERTEAIVFDMTGTTMSPYFRPPYGAYNNQVLADVGAAGYHYSIMWTVDSLGWKGIPAAEVTERCLSGAQPGAIYLFHVGIQSTDFAALPAIVSGLVEAGYQFATIPELIP
ncbi:MAG: polysaccharide deacetylase family protein [Acidimicrobiia bacterium]